MNTSEIKFLCSETERISGIKVLTFSDAERLSILLKTAKHHISPHTVARLFGVIKESRKHYRNTLSILANYIGFKDYDAFIIAYQSGYFNPYTVDFSRSFDQFIILLELYLELNDYTSIFEFIENMNENERTICMFKIAHLIGNVARKNRYSQQFIQSIKAYPTTNKLFLHTWIDEDYVNQGYLEYLKSNLDSEHSDFNTFVQAVECTSLIYSNRYERKINIDRTNLSGNSHVLSRQLEVEILEMGFSNRPVFEILNKIEIAINDFNSSNTADQLWLLGRLLRACAYLEIWYELKKSPSFNTLVQQLLNREKSYLNSTGEGIVQAYAMYAKLEYQLMFLPQSDVLNEQRNKNGLNALFLYHSNKIDYSSELQSTLIKYAKTPNMTWLRGCFKLIT